MIRECCSRTKIFQDILGLCRRKKTMTAPPPHRGRRMSECGSPSRKLSQSAACTCRGWKLLVWSVQGSGQLHLWFWARDCITTIACSSLCFSSIIHYKWNETDRKLYPTLSMVQITSSESRRCRLRAILAPGTPSLEFRTCVVRGLTSAVDMTDKPVHTWTTAKLQNPPLKYTKMCSRFVLHAWQKLRW